MAPVVSSYDIPRGRVATLRMYERHAAHLAEQWAATPYGGRAWWRAAVRYMETANRARALRGSEPITITPSSYARAGLHRKGA